jgi:hypothetical protein
MPLIISYFRGDLALLIALLVITFYNKVIREVALVTNFTGDDTRATHTNVSWCLQGRSLDAFVSKF